jgi:hypothetical protein
MKEHVTRLLARPLSRLLTIAHTVVTIIVRSIILLSLFRRAEIDSPGLRDVGYDDWMIDGFVGPH